MSVNIDDTTSKSPAAQRISQFLKRQIRSGVMRTGDKLPSYEQLAARFDTHKLSVNRALGELEREGLIERRPRSGTYVAQAGTKRRIKNIALAAGDLPDSPNESYWLQMMRGIHDGSRDQGVNILMLDHGNRHMDSRSFDGVLYNTVAADVCPVDVATVVVGGIDSRFNSFAIDDFEGGRIACAHLVSLGHKRIAYMGAWPSSTIARRRAGLEFALEEAGLPWKNEWFNAIRNFDPNRDQSSATVAREEMRGWIAEGWAQLGCTAILAQNDRHAFGIYRALAEVGMKVPGDVSVVGFDDLFESEMLDPSLTTVHVPLHRIGKLAVEKLIALIDCADIHADDVSAVVLPPKLIARQSTGAPAELQHRARQSISLDVTNPE